ncbi:MAG: hypothetical protein OSA23_15360, partial [Rhodospirillales bacterium]|nr:hypothetical protein [Rhodospirillales bacterium]
FNPDFFDPKIVAQARICLATDEENPDGVSMGVVENLLISLLRSGQEIREDITSKEGRLLLGKGTVLSKNHIKRLKVFVESAKINEPIRTVAYHYESGEKRHFWIWSSLLGFQLQACLFRHTNCLTLFHEISLHQLFDLVSRYIFFNSIT